MFKLSPVCWGKSADCILRKYGLWNGEIDGEIESGKALSEKHCLSKPRVQVEFGYEGVGM